MEPHQTNIQIKPLFDVKLFSSLIGIQKADHGQRALFWLYLSDVGISDMTMSHDAI